MIVFKKDSKGKIRFLEAYAKGDKVIQRSGLLDGKVVEREYTAKPKNVGRANATTASEQALLEAKAKIHNKMSEGYFITVEQAEDNNVVLPMLATTYEKVKDKIEWPCYAQPKLDGMRALFDNVNTGKFWSRKGKPIDTLLFKDILAEQGIEYEIDGELYAHGMSFQEVMSLIKKAKPGSEKIQFWVYDIVMENEPFDERYHFLKSVKFNENVKLVHTQLINNEAELIEYHEKNISLGYEGTIVRWGDFGYEINKRSKGLLKYKDFIDIAVPITDIVPSDKDPEQGIAECTMDNGKVFRCGMKFSHSERKRILRNKQNYIGRTAEVRFFEWTDEGIPRFPVCVGFREDK